MKKLVLLSTILATVASMSAFGQGYFIFSTAKSQVYDGYTGASAATSTTVDVAFLWAASGDVPTVSSILASVSSGTTTASSTYNIGAAWTAILNDPNFTLAQDTTHGVLAQVASTGSGAISYNGGTSFAGPLSTAPGVAYSCYLIGWNGALGATPALAAAAGASVGWSAVFAYTPSTITGIPASFSGLTPAFGVAGLPVPEPTTIALAGLGGLALLGFRRRK